MKEQTLAEKLHLDVPLLFGVCVLCIMGLVILYSAGGQSMEPVLRQAGRMVIALGLLFAVAQMPPAQLARWALAIYAAGILLLVLVHFFGDVGKGAQRWLELGVLRFQPSELMKIAVPLLLASILSEKGVPPGFLRICACCVLILVPAAIIAKQPDLGTALLIGAAGFAVLFVAGISWKLLAGLGLLAASSLPVLWYMLHDYQRRRILTFLDPEQDPLGAGYHIIQSEIAIGSGGIYGKGWLNGTQSHLDFLPERSTDFIFAVYSEEFGLMGVILLICIYMFVIARGLQIALNSQHTFGRLMGAGIILTFFVYVFVNMGMVTGQLPVVGVPLPLISAGGSSLVTLMIGFGMLMGIQTHRRMLSG
jgi:rod shape determining protein RodA